MPGGEGQRHRVVVSDTSVLVNFLRIDRMDLIGGLPDRFVITDHAAVEIANHYPAQQALLQAALAAGLLEQHSVTDLAALDLFRQLSETRRLGAGESAAIAYAAGSGFALAIDDRQAANQARALLPGLVVFRTQDLMVSMIRSCVLDVAQADSVKEAWATAHRFRLKIGSFKELL